MADKTLAIYGFFDGFLGASDPKLSRLQTKRVHVFRGLGVSVNDFTISTADEAGVPLASDSLPHREQLREILAPYFTLTGQNEYRYVGEAAV